MIDHEKLPATVDYRDSAGISEKSSYDACGWDGPTDYNDACGWDGPMDDNDACGWNVPTDDNDLSDGMARHMMMSLADGMFDG